MPDFLGVHHNPGRMRATIPYVVVVQSNQFRETRHRIVVPLIRAERYRADTPFTPHFLIDGIVCVFTPLQIVSVPKSSLGLEVMTLANEEDRVRKALDEVFAGTWT
jgi:toxin CcdB